MANKKRLIDANALLRKKYEVYEPEDPEQWGSRSYTHKVVSVEDVKKAPIVDAVEVVRCKDCKHFDVGDEFNRPLCMHPNGLKTAHESLYCPYGERRTDDNG